MAHKTSERQHKNSSSNNISELNLLFDTICEIDRNHQNSNQCDYFEIEMETSSASCHLMGSSNCSDSSTFIKLKDTKNTVFHTTIINNDNELTAEDTDIQVTNPSIRQKSQKAVNSTLLACFKTCVQCRRENPNPYFQYCYICFKYRMEYFESFQMPKRVKRLSIYDRKNPSKTLTDCQELVSSNSQTFNMVNMHNRSLVQNNNNNKSKNIENAKNLCNVCLMMPKNSSFNHGKTGHIYSCYPCTKKIWKKSNRCPACNLKVKSVTKIQFD